MSFLASLQASPIGDWVRSSDYGYYICLAIHAIGMGMVVGAIFMVCLRVLGFSKDQPLSQLQGLLNYAWAGFFLNAMSGVALFMANGEHLVKNVPFLLKISFIVAGGIFQWMLWRALEEEKALGIEGGSVAVAASGRAKTLAVLTFTCWLVAIMAGRIIGYTIDY